MTQKPLRPTLKMKTEAKESKKTQEPIIAEQNASIKPKATKNQLEKALKEAKEQVEKCKIQLTYLQAEHENFVKSTKRNEANMRLQANRDLILKLLPVLDDLERAQIMVPQIEVNSPFIKGLNIILDNLKTALKNEGVRKIECAGERFDPLRHEAVLREETTEFPPNTVIAELRSGYLLNGALLRPSMVKIAKTPQIPPAKGEESSKKKKKRSETSDEQAQEKPSK